MSRMNKVRNMAKTYGNMAGRAGAAGAIGAGVGALGMVGGAAAIGMDRSNQRQGAAGLGASIGGFAGIGASMGGSIGRMSRAAQYMGARSSGITRAKKTARGMNAGAFVGRGTMAGAGTGLGFSMLSSNQPRNRGVDYDKRYQIAERKKRMQVEQNIRQRQAFNQMDLQKTRDRARMGY